MAMTVLVLELQGGKKIRMSILSSLISVQNLTGQLNNTIAGVFKTSIISLQGAHNFIHIGTLR